MCKGCGEAKTRAIKLNHDLPISEGEAGYLHAHVKAGSCARKKRESFRSSSSSKSLHDALSDHLFPVGGRQ